MTPFANLTRSPDRGLAGTVRLALSGALLVLVYLGWRLPALLALPLFNDEAVYLVRAQSFPAMLGIAGVAGGTLPDGKLLHELALAVLAPLPVDPLIPARLLSVVCGLGTVLMLAAMGCTLGRPGAGMLAGLLYALSPLAGLHDVLGPPDSMLILVSVLWLWASVRFAIHPAVGRRDALLVGALLVVASLVKLSGLICAACAGDPAGAGDVVRAPGASRAHPTDVAGCWPARSRCLCPQRTVSPVPAPAALPSSPWKHGLSALRSETLTCSRRDASLCAQ